MAGMALGRSCKAVMLAVASACACSGFAQQPEEMKLEIVKLVYKTTYGTREFCKRSPESTADVDRAVEQFESAYPELMGLVNRSPYLTPAKNYFNAVMSDPSMQASGEQAASTCRAVVSMLRQFIEVPSAKEQLNKFVQVLKQ